MSMALTTHPSSTPPSLNPSSIPSKSRLLLLTLPLSSHLTFTLAQRQTSRSPHHSFSTAAVMTSSTHSSHGSTSTSQPATSPSDSPPVHTQNIPTGSKLSSIWEKFWLSNKASKSVVYWRTSQTRRTNVIWMSRSHTNSRRTIRQDRRRDLVNTRCVSEAGTVDGWKDIFAAVSADTLVSFMVF